MKYERKIYDLEPIENLVKSKRFRHQKTFGQTFKSWLKVKDFVKIKLLVKHWKVGQKSKISSKENFWSNIEKLVKSQRFRQKKLLVKHWKVGQKSKISSKKTFGKKFKS